MKFADKLTFLRIILIPFFITFLFCFNEKTLYVRYIILGIFAIAVLTDFFDGLVARIQKQKSELGQIIDPLADKLLLFTSFIFLYCLRNSLPLRFALPRWVVLIVVIRELVMLAGFSILFFMKKEVFYLPSLWGKLTTVFQMATILSILIDIPFSPFIWTGAALFTVISGTEYFLRGVKAAYGRITTVAS